MEKGSASLRALRHTAEHILTQAMLELYPNIKMAMGPATDSGFYFDFDPANHKISQEDFPEIEKKMAEIIQADLPLKQEIVSVKKARQLFPDNPYKQEWLDEIEERGEQASLYWTGDKFVDLCAGPHTTSTGKVRAVKLLSLAGAYWRGDEKNKMLTRIYGTAFASKEELEKYLKNLEEAKKRDHRKLGKQLDLFSFHPEAPADVFWHPKGYTVMKELFRYWREIHDREGYVEVRTPEILAKRIWEQSGHTGFYLRKMYRVLTPDAKEWDMAIKPMNCDGGMLIYKSRQRSYRELPLRMGELGIVHRFESSGETLGVLRPREFTQDDAHIYCEPGQVKAELKRVIDLCFEVYNLFGLQLDHLELSTRPEKSIGSDQVWERAEGIMREILEEGSVAYQINEGEGAFYGPKFDFHLKDAVGRTWQCSTIQLDFAQPENFDLTYITKEGKKARPVMIHRVLYGSVERFMGILIEHFAGAFPTWLAPVQATIIPISEKQLDYARQVAGKLRSRKIRVEVDDKDATMQAKIRDAQLQKTPYMLIIGEREKEKGTVTARGRASKNQQTLPLNKFADKLLEEIKSRSLTSFLS